MCIESAVPVEQDLGGIALSFCEAEELQYLKDIHKLILEIQKTSTILIT